MNSPVTVADELLVQNLPEEVLSVLDKMFGDTDRMDYAYMTGKQDAFREARKNLRNWFFNNPRDLTQNDIDELECYLNT